MKFELTTKKDLEDFTTGCCFFGTGGGGNASFGHSMLQEALDVGKKIIIEDLSDIDDDSWIVCPYLMGTSGPETNETKQDKIKHGMTATTVSNMPAAAVDLLLAHSARDTALSAIVPYEIGAAATSSAVATAAMLGVPTIDADFVGRSVPEATQMLPALYGLDLCPTACADAFGNESMITKVVNRHMAERTGKHIASASFGLIGQATLLRQAKDLKRYMLPGTLSRAFAVGKALRDNASTPEGVESALNALVGAKKIFEGKITAFDGGDDKGYYVGTMVIEGENTFEGSGFKIWFKNENHIAWKDDEVCLTSPDLICTIDQKTHQPYVNNQLSVGMNISVYGTPAHQAWYEKKALEANCPRYYGFAFEAKFVE